MKRFTCKEDALDHIRNELRINAFPTFAEEYNGSSGREFVVCSYDEYTKRYAKLLPDDRRTHELFFSDTKMKFFLDLESKTVPLETFNAACARLVDFAKELMMIEFNRKVGDPIAFDASRREKRSRHVIFDTVYFRDVDSQREFIKEVFIKRCPDDLREFVDTGVYVAGKSMRVPYSRGDKRPVPLLPIGTDNKIVSDGFDPVAFTRGLLHRQLPGVEVLPYAAAIVGKRSFEHVDAAAWIHEEWEAMKDSLKRWCEANKYDFGGASLESNNGIQLIVGNMACVSKGEPHASNNTYIHIRLPRRSPAELSAQHCFNVSCPSTCRCPDEACNRFSWRGPDFFAVLFESRIREYVRRCVIGPNPPIPQPEPKETKEPKEPKNPKEPKEPKEPSSRSKRRRRSEEAADEEE